MRTILRFLLAIIAVAALSDWAAADDVRAFRFSRAEVLSARALLGPGGARGVSIQLSFGPPEFVGGEELSAVVTSNPPGCGEASVSIDGDFVSCGWQKDCLDPFEAVDMCFRAAQGPISVVSADFVDEYGAIIAPAIVEEIPATCGTLDCSGARAANATLWPPNHALVPVTIEGVAGLGVTIEATAVTADEQVNARGDGNTCPDAEIMNGVAYVRRERAGGGNGRVYEVSFIATDGAGAQCEGRVQVCVPANQGTGATCVDDGQTVDALAPCARRANRTQGRTAGELELLAFAVRSGDKARVEFSIPKAAPVTLGVYDVTGRRVATVTEGTRAAGRHAVTWSPRGLARGVYFYRLRAGEATISKLILILHE